MRWHGPLPVPHLGRQAKDGIDPIESRRAEPEKIPTFTACAELFIGAHRSGWKNVKHAQQWVSTIETYAEPVIGSKRVNAMHQIANNSAEQALLGDFPSALDDAVMNS